MLGAVPLCTKPTFLTTDDDTDTFEASVSFCRSRGATQARKGFESSKPSHDSFGRETEPSPENSRPLMTTRQDWPMTGS